MKSVTKFGMICAMCGKNMKRVGREYKRACQCKTGKSAKPLTIDQLIAVRRSWAA